MNNWINGENDLNELVISSRVRLARNLEKTPFPSKLDEERSNEIINKISETCKSEEDLKDLKLIKLVENDPIEIGCYLEKHLISKNLIDKLNKTAFLIDKDETISLMINEEDHIRLQCITAGLDLKNAYEKCDEIDSLLENKLDYAFHENLGYLTACPTNLGTGMRASVMVHLPALTIYKEIPALLKNLTQFGITMRGLYGEGSSADGNIYQLSNQITLGLSEADIISNLEGVLSQVIDQEKKKRDLYVDKYKYEFLDRIYRAIGILQNSIIISAKESLELLSYVRMGVEMAIIDDISINLLNELLVITQPNNIKMCMGKDISDREQDIERARIIRERLKIKKEVE